MEKRKGLLTVLLFVVALVMFSSCGDLAGDGDGSGIPAVVLEYKNNLAYKADAGYNAWVCSTNSSNTLIVANVTENGATITKVEFLWDAGTQYESIGKTDTSAPYEFTVTYPWEWGGPVLAAAKVYYESNSVTSTVTSAVVESYMYSPWYETCVATNTNGNAGFLFRAEPGVEFYAGDFTGTGTGAITAFYIVGEFNGWAGEDANYQMTWNDPYYEIILTNISAEQAYKFTCRKSGHPDLIWLVDKANYWTIGDGTGGWNSVCHN